MKPVYRGILVAALQCLLVLSVAGKYALDRERLPRVWARTLPVDPNLPIRGRYLSLRVEVDASRLQGSRARLAVADGRLVALPDARGAAVLPWRGGAWTLVEPVAYFLPEHAADPSRLGAGEELWVEVSVPPRGAPRPLRLGIRKNGVLTPNS